MVAIHSTTQAAGVRGKVGFLSLGLRTSGSRIGLISLKERLQKHHPHPHHDAGIGHVKRGPVVDLFPMKVQEVDDEAKTKPIDQIPHGAGEDEAERARGELLILLQFYIKNANHNHRHDGNDDEKGITEPGGCPMQQTEGRAGVADVSEGENRIDDRNALAPPESSVHQMLRPLIEYEYNDHRSQENAIFEA